MVPSGQMRPTDVPMNVNFRSQNVCTSKWLPRRVQKESPVENITVGECPCACVRGDVRQLSNRGNADADGVTPNVIKQSAVRGLAANGAPLYNYWPVSKCYSALVHPFARCPQQHMDCHCNSGFWNLDAAIPEPRRD